MKSVEEFLRYAAQLEREAALRFGELADAAKTNGNAPVADFFRQMSEYSRMHLKQAMDRGGFHDLPDMTADEFRWPGMESPEAAAIWGADPHMDVGLAMAVALEAEQRGLAFYRDVLDQTDDPEIKAMAEEFVAEEAEHVQAIERWISRLAS